MGRQLLRQVSALRYCFRNKKGSAIWRYRHAITRLCRCEGLIFEHVLRKYDKDHKLAPNAGTNESDAISYWFHYSEGTSKSFDSQICHPLLNLWLYSNQYIFTTQPNRARCSSAQRSLHWLQDLSWLLALYITMCGKLTSGAKTSKEP